MTVFVHFIELLGFVCVMGVLIPLVLFIGVDMTHRKNRRQRKDDHA